MTIYRISKWNEVFETAESRRYKHLQWVAMPIGLSSSGYQSLLDDHEEQAAAIYGAWCALVAVAASCTVRGLLCNSRGQALKLTHIARRTGFQVPLLEQMLTWAAMPEVGWLECVTEEEARAELAKKAEKNDCWVAPGSHPGATQEPPSNHPGATQQLPELHNSTATAQHITEHHQQQQLASTPAAAAAAEMDFGRLEWQQVCQAAARLDRVAGGLLEADFIWQFAWVSELVKPGFFSETATRIKAREVTKPKGYIRKALSDECTAQGVSLVELLSRVPARPQTQTVNQ